MRRMIRFRRTGRTLACRGGGGRLRFRRRWQGKRIFLHVRGAHLRAEVYLNEKLVGYSIMEELPFERELTHAAKPRREECAGDSDYESVGAVRLGGWAE